MKLLKKSICLLMFSNLVITFGLIHLMAKASHSSDSQIDAISPENFKEITINTFFPKTIETNQASEIILEGHGFDQNTRAILLPQDDDSILGSIELPRYPVQDIVIIDNIAYIANGDLILIDVLNPVSPKIIASIETPGFAKDLSIIDKIVYIADTNGFRIIDVSNPISLKIVGSLDLDGFSYDSLAVVNQTVYLSGFDRGLQRIDVSDIYHPKVIDLFETNYPVDSITGMDNKIYATSAFDLSIIDCNLPVPEIFAKAQMNSWWEYVKNLSPIEKSVIEKYDSSLLIRHAQNISWWEYVQNLSIIEKTAYILDAYDYLHIYDISEDNNYEEKSNKKLSWYSMGMDINGRIAYVGCRENGIQIIDVSDSCKPTIIDYLNPPGTIAELKIADNKMYIFDGTIGFGILQLPSEIEILSYSENSLSLRIPPQKFSSNMRLKVYNAQYEVTEILHVDSPINIPEIPDQIIQGNGDFVSIPLPDSTGKDYTISVHSLDKTIVSDDNIYLDLSQEQKFVNVKPNHNKFGEMQIGLSITNGQSYLIDQFNVSVEFQEIETDLIVPEYHTIGNNAALTIVGNNFDRNTRAILIPKEENTIIGSVEVHGIIEHIAFSENIAIVTGDKVYLVDIKNSFSPQIISTIETPDTTEKIFVIEHLAYVACLYNGLQIIDFSDPFHPTIIGSVDIKGRVSGLTAVDHIMYVGTYSGHLYVIDISDPVHPQKIGQINRYEDIGIWLAPFFHNSSVHTQFGYDDTIYFRDFYTHETNVITKDKILVMNITNINSPQIIGFFDFFDCQICNEIDKYNYNVHIDRWFDHYPHDIIDLYNPEILKSEYKVQMDPYGDSLQIIDSTIPNNDNIIATIHLPVYPNSVSIKDDMIYITEFQDSFSIIPMPTELEVIDFTDTTLSVKVPHPKISGTMELIVFNPEYENSFDIEIKNPIEIPDQAISGNAEFSYLSFTLNEIQADTVLQNYSISFHSSNPLLITENNIFLEDDEDQIRIKIKPRKNKIGTANISLILSNENETIIETFELSVVFKEPHVDSFKSEKCLSDDCHSKVSIEGKGFDDNSQIIFIPNGNNEIFGAVNMFNYDSQDLTVKGQTAYLLDSQALRIIDISNPFNPIIMGSIITPGTPKQMAVIDKKAYIADTYSLQIVDIIDPYKPEIISFVDSLPAIDVDVIDQMAYVATAEGLSIVNVQDALHPKIVGCIKTLNVKLNNNYDNDAINFNLISANNNLVFFTNRNRELEIIDVQEPSNPQIKNSVPINGNVMDFLIIDQIAYVTYETENDNIYLYIVDISDPNNIRIISSIENTPMIICNATDDKIYLTNEHQIYMLDIRDIKHPDLIQICDKKSKVIEIVDGIMYSGFKGLDIIPEPIQINPEKTIITNTLIQLTIPTIKISGDYQLKVYNSQFESTKDIYLEGPVIVTEIPDQTISGNSESISIPFTLSALMSGISFENYTVSVHSFDQHLVSDNNILVEISENDSQIQIKPNKNQFGEVKIILAVSNDFITVVESFFLNVEFPSINIQSANLDSNFIGNVSMLTIGGQAFDQSTKSALFSYQPIGFCNTGKIYDIAVVDNKACVLTDYEFQIIDLNGYYYPTINAAIDMPGQTSSVFVADDIAYVLVDKVGLYIIDISDSDYPKIINTISIISSCIDVKVVDQFAYVSLINEGVMIIDISDLEQPKIISSTDPPKLNCKWADGLLKDYQFLWDEDLEFFDPYYPFDVDANNQRIYVADGDSIIHTYDVTNPFALQKINTIEIPGYDYSRRGCCNDIPEDIFIHNQIGYVLNYRYLNIIDINNVSQSKVISQTFLPGSQSNVIVIKNIAYISADYKGLLVVDISDLSAPKFIGTIDIKCNIVAANDEMLFWGNETGLSIIPFAVSIEDISVQKDQLSLTIPPLKYAGNYQLTVYNSQHEDNTIISFQSPFKIIPISDQTIYPEIKQAAFNLSIQSLMMDSENRSYTVSAYSGNSRLIPDNNIMIEGSGKNRTIKITCAEHRYGTTPIYITVDDGHASLMEKFDLTVKFPQLNYKWHGDDLTSNHFNSITHVLNSNGYLFQSDNKQHCIKKYLNDELVYQWGQQGNDNGEFNTPLGMAIDEAGFLYVVDSGNNRVQVFTPYGEFITTIGEYGSGKLNQPEAIAIENDVIYVSGAGNETIQSFKKVDYTEGITKAIIIAGGGSQESNNIWLETTECTNLAYRALIYQGLSKDTIQYLSSETTNELVDDIATIDSIGRAITQWAIGETMADNEVGVTADSLVIYLADHGGDGSFRVNENEILSATVLNQWLNEIEEKIPGKLVFIYDACNSGSFIPYLSQYSKNRERILITSSSSKEPAYFMGFGGHSFSNYFWGSIYNGQDIKDAFITAQQAMSITLIATQSPQINIDGNRLNNEKLDLNGVQNVFIGNGIDVQFGLPVIDKISPHQIISDSSSAEITVSCVRSLEKISCVWAQIISSNYSPELMDKQMIHFPTIQLEKTDDGSYSGHYNGFNNEGSYQIAVYAKDKRGITSYPMLTSVTVNNPLKRSAIIVMGDSGSEPVTMLVENAESAALALKSQGYFDTDIETIRGDSDNVTQFKAKLFQYTEEEAQDIVLYMTGNGNYSDFSFTQTDSLSSDTLTEWLDQMDQNTLITIIYDAPYSYQYLQSLKTAHDNCILISSTSQEKYVSYQFLNGLLSFSRYFWNQISNGYSLHTSYRKTSSAIYTFFNCEQEPSIINGEDRARNYRMGYGFRYGDDIPTIESISAYLSNETTSLSIHAKNVNSIHSIKKVVAIIKAPDNFTTKEKLTLVELNQIEHTNNYSALDYHISGAGKYYISICAIDSSGNISKPLSTTVQTTIGLQYIISGLQLLTGINDAHPIPSQAILFKKEKFDLKEMIHLIQLMLP